MAEMNYITKKEMFERVIDIVLESGNEHATLYAERLQHEIDLLNKKYSNKSKKSNAEANELKETILNSFPNDNTLVSPTEFLALLNYEYSVQKIAYRLNELVKEGKLEKIKEKKKVFYKLA